MERKNEENRGKRKYRKKRGRRYYKFDCFEEDGWEENNIFTPPVLTQFQITGGRWTQRLSRISRIHFLERRF